MTKPIVERLRVRVEREELSVCRVLAAEAGHEIQNVTAVTFDGPLAGVRVGQIHFENDRPLDAEFVI